MMVTLDRRASKLIVPVSLSSMKTLPSVGMS